MSKKIFYTRLTPKPPHVSQGGNFILALLVGITFGFSFGCLVMNVYNWEHSKEMYKPPPLPSQIEYSRVQKDLKHYLERKVKDDHHLFPDARLVKRPLNPIDIHEHSSEYGGFHCQKLWAQKNLKFFRSSRTKCRNRKFNFKI